MISFSRSMNPLSLLLPLLLIIPACRTYDVQKYLDPHPFNANETRLTPVFGFSFTSKKAIRDLGPILGASFKRCSGDPTAHGCPNVLQIPKNDAQSSAVYDQILQSSFPETRGTGGYLVITPVEIVQESNELWFALQAPLLLLPSLLGAPAKTQICHIRMRADLITPGFKGVKTYTASGDGWAPVALYWGYGAIGKGPDGFQAACSDALTESLESLKSQLNQDRQFIMTSLK